MSRKKKVLESFWTTPHTRCAHTYAHKYMHGYIMHTNYTHSYTYSKGIGIWAFARNRYNHVLALLLTEMQTLRPGEALELGARYSSSTT